MNVGGENMKMKGKINFHSIMGVFIVLLIK